MDTMVHSLQLKMKISPFEVPTASKLSSGYSSEGTSQQPKVQFCEMRDSIQSYASLEIGRLFNFIMSEKPNTRVFVFIIVSVE